MPTQPVRWAEQCGTTGEPGWEIQIGILVLPLSTPVSLAEPLDDCSSHEIAGPPCSSPEKEKLIRLSFPKKNLLSVGAEGKVLPPRLLATPPLLELV